jgi:hypothetical protein
MTGHPPALTLGRRQRRSLAATALVATLALWTVGSSALPPAASSTAAASLPAAAPGTGAAAVSVSVDPRHPGRPVPRSFLGLSFELSAAEQLAAYADEGNLVTLLHSLGRGVLRFGGVSADTRVAWVDARTPKPEWASVVLDAHILHGLRRLAQRSGWRILLTLGLAHYEPVAAGREARAAKAILGRWLAGIEVGNEPDAYARHQLRTLPWTPSAYETQVTTYRRAIGKRARRIPLAGPGVSGSRAFAHWGLAEARRQRPALLTGHHYPLRCDAGPSIEQLLSQRTRELEGASLARYVSLSRARSIDFRLDEANTVSCGGVAGISDTFASALWATGYLAQAMSTGMSGINLQGNPANCSGYTPVCAPTPERLVSGVLRPQPEWYALLLGHALIGDRALTSSIVAPTSPNVSVTAFRAHHGGLAFVIVEDESAGPGADLSLQVGGQRAPASVLTLTAPTPDSRSGVTLGGRAAAGGGKWRPLIPLPQVPVIGGVVSLHLSPASAMLVSVPAVPIAVEPPGSTRRSARPTRSRRRTARASGPVKGSPID